MMLLIHLIMGMITVPIKSCLEITNSDHEILKKVDPAPWKEAPLVLNDRSFKWVTDKICGIVESKTPTWWWWCFITALCVASFTGMGLIYLVSTGVGVWGNNNPVNWGWAIVNFVFWIGIGHAGTLISAVLCLLKQKWRTSINRASEAMTVLLSYVRGFFRSFMSVEYGLRGGFFLYPIPTQSGRNSAVLLSDVFAVSTYATVSILFWYMGMIPDMAVLRDRAKETWRKYFYGIFAMGWRNANNHWRNFEMAYLLLAGLSTPLVLSVHTIVSFDFAVANLPGWHTTIFPPYFVAGAIFSGFGMVLTLLLPVRAVFGLHDLITQKHVDNMCMITLATGSLVGYACDGILYYWYGANSEGFCLH